MQDADDAFVSVEKFSEGAACFLVPVAVTAAPARYAEGKADMVAFNPVALREHIGNGQRITVGAEERTVEADQLGCLENPTPRWIAIKSRFAEAAPVTVGEMTAYAKETSTDIPGYVRYFDMVGDYYVADIRPEARVSFLCRRVPEIWRDFCLIGGDYDDMIAVLAYHKSEMADVRPEQALQCARAIADLFRVAKSTGAN
ncbi:MAG TPA: hypothetical protein VJ790_04955 [Dongiaceae bacterium]|nr:hypothetical protein [Dongiaceae bacterium]